MDADRCHCAMCDETFETEGGDDADAQAYRRLYQMVWGGLPISLRKGPSSPTGTTIAIEIGSGDSLMTGQGATITLALNDAIRSVREEGRG